MKTEKKYSFKAIIYKTGINFAVDVPEKITSQLDAIKGYIKIKGTINDFPFKKSLVPVKNGLYRLFVNIPTLKGAGTKTGETARFIIEQDIEIFEKDFPMPKLLTQQLKQKKLLQAFNDLSTYRKKEILKYFSFIKTEETFQRNAQKLIYQLEQKINPVKIP